MNPRKCFLLADDIPCFVHLCKFGDQMILLPALREIHRKTGIKPVVLAKPPYHTVYDGVSYADCIPVTWKADVAREFGWHMFGNAIVTKWWEDSSFFFHDVVQSEYQLRLAYQGKAFVLDKREHPNYMVDQWLATGFSESDMTSLPLVFDRRSRERERELVQLHARQHKPIFLINFEGGTSPFAPVPEVMASLHPLLSQFQVIDLGQIQARRIYDLLGLYDVAVALITADTSTLHLAAASRIPYIAYTNGGWGRSVPRGNCVCEITYAETMNRIDELCDAVRRIISNANSRLDTIRPEGPSHTSQESFGARNLEVATVV